MLNSWQVVSGIALIACAGFGGCSFTYRDSPPYDGPNSRSRPEPRVELIWIPMLDTESLPGSGAYYDFVFEPNQFEIVNLKGMIADMYARGFDITDAWYHGPSHCAPPDAEFTTGTIYHPTLVVHLSHPDDGMARFHFRRINSPSSLLCPYSLTLYAITPDSTDHPGP